jgi:hypothetical protein
MTGKQSKTYAMAGAFRKALEERLKQHIDQLTTPGNIAGSFTLSSAASRAWTFPAGFTVGSICVGSPGFSSTVNCWVTPSLSSCTVTYTTALSGTFYFVVVGNPQ